VKSKILGLNAAKLFGVDPAEARKAIPKDKLSELKTGYLHRPDPTNTQFGWVWRAPRGGKPRLPIGS